MHTFSHIIFQATRPLMMMMCHWMVDGELIDNYYEFFIYQTQDLPNNLDIWNNRYKIRCVLF